MREKNRYLSSGYDGGLVIWHSIAILWDKRGPRGSALEQG